MTMRRGAAFGAGRRLLSVLSAVPNVQDFDDRFLDPVDDDGWQRRKNQFAGALLASDPAAMWRSDELLDALKDRPDGLERCLGVVFGNA